MGPEMMAGMMGRGKDMMSGCMTGGGMMGPEAKRALPALTRLLCDTETNVRTVGAHTLGSMGLEARPAVPAASPALSGGVTWASGRPLPPPAATLPPTSS